MPGVSWELLFMSKTVALFYHSSLRKPARRLRATRLRKGPRVGGLPWGSEAWATEIEEVDLLATLCLGLIDPTGIT
jgi:hypothetical protein